MAEKKLAALEGAQEGLLFASGMAAITTTLFAMLSQGRARGRDRRRYRRTRQFLGQVLRRYGVEVTTVPAGDYERMGEAIRRTTRLVFSETPTNPYNRVVDLERLAELGRRHRVKTVIDSTFATPINQRPIEFGVDLVIHSATKYLGGHNDLMAGVVLGSRALVGAIRDLHSVTGAVPDPFAAYLLIRGIKTLALRVARQNENAQRIAEFLEAHPKVERVHYPGLKSHPEHDVARRQMKGFGGVVSFEVRGDLAAGTRLVDALPDPPDRPVAGRGGEPDRAAGAHELLRAVDGGAPSDRNQGHPDPLRGGHRGRRRPGRGSRSGPGARVDAPGGGLPELRRAAGGPRRVRERPARVQGVLHRHHRRRQPERYEWDRCGRERDSVLAGLKRAGVEGIGFVCAFPHIAKAFRFGPESETVLHVRAFRPADFTELDLGRSDGYVEYACLAESVIADAEYRAWAAARSVEEYLAGWVDWQPVAVADEGKLGRHYRRPFA